ncbi:hypothetical protein IW261DRAFT_1512755, partial [Armillaria novae-zelandiae]
FFFSLSFGVCILRYSSLAVCFFCIYCRLVMTLCYAVSLDETTLPSLYFDPLYFPGLHQDVFKTEEKASQWLHDIFCSESGWDNIKATYFL